MQLYKAGSPLRSVAGCYWGSASINDLSGSSVSMGKRGLMLVMTHPGEPSAYEGPSGPQLRRGGVADGACTE